MFTGMQIPDWFLIPLTSHPIGLSRDFKHSPDPGTHQQSVSLPTPLFSKQEVNATFTEPTSIHAALNALHSQITTSQPKRAYGPPSVLLHSGKDDPSPVAPEPKALMCPGRDTNTSSEGNTTCIAQSA